MADPSVSAVAGDADNVVLLRVAGGDHGAMEMLYDRYERRLFGLGVQLLGDRDLAEELVQETFVRVWQKAGRFDPDLGSATTFVFTIARRLAIDLWRRKAARPRLADTDQADEPIPFPSGVDEVVARVVVRDALQQLSPPHRQVLDLAYTGGMTQTEIAAEIGVPVGTVKTRTYHALRSLRSILGEMDVHV